MFKIRIKATGTTSITLFWCLYCELLTCFILFSIVSIDLEKVFCALVLKFKEPMFASHRNEKIRANQLTGFYVSQKLGINGLKNRSHQYHTSFYIPTVALNRLNKDVEQLIIS